MRIKLLKPYGFSRPGDVLDPDDPVAQLLIGRGIAEVDAPGVSKEIAAPSRRESKSNRAAKRRKARR